MKSDDWVKLIKEEFDDKLYENIENVFEVYDFTNKKIGEING